MDSDKKLITLGLCFFLILAIMGISIYKDDGNVEWGRKQSFLRVAYDTQVAENFLAKAGEFAEPGSASFWLHVGKIISDHVSMIPSYAGMSQGEISRIGQMSSLAKEFADGAKTDELFQLVSGGGSYDSLLRALVASGAPGERDWKKTADILARRLQIDPELAMSDGKAVEKMIANIQAFIKERDRFFAKSS